MFLQNISTHLPDNSHIPEVRNFIIIINIINISIIIIVIVVVSCVHITLIIILTH